MVKNAILPYFGGHLGFSAILDFLMYHMLIDLDSWTLFTLEKAYYKLCSTHEMDLYSRFTWKEYFRCHLGGHLGFSAILDLLT